MPSLEDFRAFSTKIEAAGDLASVKLLLQQHIGALGFERFAYVQLKVPDHLGRIYIGTYPIDWSQFYAARNLQVHDPVWECNYRSIRPYLWEDVLAQTDDSKVAERLVMGPGADAGLRAGAGVPLHGPSGIIASFAVASDIGLRSFRDLFHERRIELQITAYAAHERIVELSAGILKVLPIQLSPRQREVLLWAVRGKTNWEIGEILSISEDTVRQHIGKVARALNAKNRTQLAALTVTRDLLSTQDYIGPVF